LRRDAAHGHIRRRARAAQGHIDDDVQLRRRDGALGIAGDAREIGDHAGLVLIQAAAHFVGGAIAQDDGDVGRAGLIEHGAKAFADGQHADEHRHHSCDTHERHHGRGHALGHVAQVHGGDLHYLRQCVAGHVSLSSMRRRF
jgi:hypothetical protein